MKFLVDSANLTIPGIAGVGRTDGCKYDFDNWGKLLRDNEVGRHLELKVIMNATHSGTVVNRRVYPGKHMQDGADSWVYPYSKPVLNDHPSMGGLFGGGTKPNVLGRIDKAEYVRLVDEEHWQSDWKHPGVGDLGSGFTRLYTSITDKDAIEGVMSGRLLTVSTGQFTDKLTCSICGSNHMHDGCEHPPGTYIDIESDRKNGVKGGRYLAYGITGKLKYDHVAFVNTPGSPFAAVVHMDESGEIQDYEEDTNGSLLDFQVAGLMLKDEHGPIHFTLDEHSVFEDTQSDARHVAAVIGSLGFEEPKQAKRKQRKKRPTVNEGTVTTVVTSDQEESTRDNHKENLMTTMAQVAEALVLRSLLDGGLEFDWEAYKDKTGNDRSLAELADADVVELSKLPEPLRKALSDGLKNEDFVGPENTLPVVDEHTGKAVRRLLPFISVDDKAAIDAGIEARINGEVLEDQAPELDSEEAKALHDENEQLRKQLADAIAKVSKLETDNKIMRKQIRQDLVDKIMGLRQDLGKADIMGLSEDKLKVYAEKLRARSIESLKDTLEDLKEESNSKAPDREDIAQVDDVTLPATDSESGSKPEVDSGTKPTKENAEESDPLFKLGRLG